MLSKDGSSPGADDLIASVTAAAPPAVRCRTTADNRGRGAAVDDAPYTGDLDLDAVTTRDKLVALLQTVYARADRPSLRTLEATTRHGATPLSRTVVSEMLRGTRFPHKAVMIAFLRACGVPGEGVEPWQRAWERAVLNEQGSPRLEATQAVSDRSTGEITTFVDSAEITQLREQVNRLTEVNELLRSQLTANKPQATEELHSHSEAHGGETSGPLTNRRTVSSDRARSMWHFPDGSRITLVCSRMPPDRRPPSSDPDRLNYVRWSDLADLDALIEIHGTIRAHNPTSRVVIMAAQDLRQQDVANHLVLIGGLTWEAVTPWFSHIFSIPIKSGDPAGRGAIVVSDPDGEELEFRYQMDGNELVEDVGFFIRGENPSAPRRTLTICGGITTRGVLGAARCFIDWEMRERNDEYLSPRFPKGSTYCIVMRVPVVNSDPLTPDLSKKENRLFEWSDGGPKDG